MGGGEEGRVVERERKEETGEEVKGKKRGRSRWEERKRGNHVRELHDYYLLKGNLVVPCYSKTLHQREMLHFTSLITWQEACTRLLPNTITHNNNHSDGSQDFNGFKRFISSFLCCC